MKTQLCKKLLNSKCFVVVLEILDTNDLLRLNLVSLEFYDDKIPNIILTLKLNRLKCQVVAMLKTFPKELDPEV